MSASVGERLVAAIAAQDAGALGACFAEGAELRALIPPGLRERTGPADAAGLIAGWFADSTELRLVDSHVETLSDRVHVTYRFAGVENDEPYVVEQQLYCTVSDDAIVQASLLCSGFRPA